MERIHRTSREALQAGCSELGGQSQLARHLGVTPGSVNQWFTGDRQIPAARCIQVERATSGAVTCEELRPDVSWVRIPDAAWPHPQGRPLVDFTDRAGS